MSEKTKAVNYTEAQAERVAEVYQAADSDETRKEAVTFLADEMGRKPASIRAKLVSLKIYRKPEYVSKKGSTVETKDKIVSTIAGILGVTEAQLGGLEKATKPALELIREKYLGLAKRVNETQPDSE